MEFINSSQFRATKKIFPGIVLLGIGLSLCASAGAGAGGGNQKVSTNQFVREVMENEVRAQKEDRSLWQYEEKKTENGKIELLEVVETPHGDFHRLCAVNGQPLSPEMEKKEEARIHHLISDKQAFRAERRKQEEDEEQEFSMLRMLGNAFVYQNAGTDGNFLKVNFSPNPSFHPPTREDEVFHHMSGTLWLDPNQKRLARMSGMLTSEVNFGWGILGHLAKGGTFEVEQKEVGKGYWELTRLDVNMTGKVLFFKTIDMKQGERNSNFRPVPGEITLEQAVLRLKSGSQVSAKKELGY